MTFPRNRLRPARLASLASLAMAAAFTFGPSQAQNVLPSHGVVMSGAASIGQSGANMTVNQTSSRAIVNWGSFSIGPSNGVTFDQPSASSAILNRVTGSTTTTIAGQLQANGQVYLVNPNGIAITKTGAVQVGGGFVASTLGIADNDFNKGNLNFVGAGASAGVSNAGSITAAPGGFVGLLGGTVANSGVVSVPLGKVAMGSGEQATLNLTGDNFLQVAVPTNTKTADGQALIDVSGKVRAAGGSVELKAATVAQAIRNAVNVPGELSVTSARASGGSIILGGGPGGDVSVTGRLRASGRTAGGTIAITGHNLALRRAKLMASSAKGRGGSVTVTGTNAVSLVSSLVDASGATGGGAIRIGGDLHGASDLISAQTTTIDKATTLNASATASGDGGTVAVWSDATTNFAGRITATGGPSGGDGGYVEVSANPATQGVLAYSGFADLTAPKGKTGTLLLDPFDITICGACADVGGSFSGGVYTPIATSFISTATLETQLGAANVSVSTGLAGSPGPDEGNLTVSAPFTWASANSLTLEAANLILINAAISATGAGASLGLTAGGDIIETTAGSIAAPTLSATSSTGRVVLTAFNTVGSVSGSAPGGFSFSNSGALDVGAAGITSSGGSIALQTITGSITQTGPVRGLALFAHAGTDGTGDVILNNPNNAIGTLAGAAPGSFQFANTAGAGLTVGTVNYFISSTTDTPAAATGSGVASGVFGAPGATIQVSTAGNLVVDSPVQDFIPGRADRSRRNWQFHQQCRSGRRRRSMADFFGLADRRLFQWSRQRQCRGLEYHLRPARSGAGQSLHFRIAADDNSHIGRSCEVLWRGRHLSGGRRLHDQRAATGRCWRLPWRFGQLGLQRHAKRHLGRFSRQSLGRGQPISNHGRTRQLRCFRQLRSCPRFGGPAHRRSAAADLRRRRHELDFWSHADYRPSDAVWGGASGRYSRPDPRRLQGRNARRSEPIHPGGAICRTRNRAFEP